MKAQAVGAGHVVLQARAGDEVDVGGFSQRALEVLLHAVAPAFHALGFLGQGGRQILRCGQIMLTALLVGQPDPAGVQVEQFGGLGQRGM